MKEEIWNNIEGFEGKYMVSSFGRVKRLSSYYRRTEIILNPPLGSRGYLQIILSNNGKRKTYLVHRLVAKAFIPNPNNLTQVNHKDENKQNNCVDNLEWCDSKYNINYGNGIKKRVRTNVKNGVYDKIGKINKKNFSKPINQYTKEGVFIKKWDCIMDIQRELGFDHRQINNCLKHRQKTAKGYVWQYADFYETKKAS